MRLCNVQRRRKKGKWSSKLNFNFLLLSFCWNMWTTVPPWLHCPPVPTTNVLCLGWFVSFFAFLRWSFFVSPQLHPCLNCKAGINQEHWGVSPPPQTSLSSVLVSALFSRGVAVRFPSAASRNPNTNTRSMRIDTGSQVQGKPGHTGWHYHGRQPLGRAQVGQAWS